MAMLVITEGPQRHHGKKSQRRSLTPTRKRLAWREECGQNQPGDQKNIKCRLEDENCVPRIPLLPKWPERTYAVIVGEVEQDVADAGDIRENEQQPPSRGQIGDVRLFSPH